MIGGRTANGFTLIEVLIFLAISGALFLVAMLTINGQEAKADFAQGTRDFQTSVEDSINDIRNGNFPENSTFSCNVSGGGSPSFAAGAPVGQGTQSRCIFLGKVLQFSSAAPTVNIYSVAARRVNTLNKDVGSYSEARPVAAPTPQFLETFHLTGGIEVTGLMSRKGGTVFNTIGAVGFFNAFTDTSSTKPTNNNLVTVVPIAGSTLGGNPTSVIPNLTTNGDANAGPDATVICLAQGGIGGPRAALIIGSEGAQTTTELYIDDIDVPVNNAVGAPCP